MSRVGDLIRLARPLHWTKNVFVLLPLPFALRAGATLDIGRFAIGFVGFCLVNSAIYVLNDILDRERDRAHPRKQTRPVASGRVSPSVAGVYGICLLGAGLGLGWRAEPSVAVLAMIAYAVLNIIYSLGAKHVALLDVFFIASGFVIRVLIGCALLEVPASSWLLLCSSTLALLLAFGKRRADLMEGLDASHRPSLGDYDLGFLELALGISAGLTLLSYALYCKDSAVFRSGFEFASLPFAAFGVFQYLRLVHTGEGKKGPVELLYSHPSFWITGALWLATVVACLA